MQKGCQENKKREQVELLVWIMSAVVGVEFGAVLGGN